ncbi:MAG: hypothetical protein ACO20H_09445 [Bacteriovoracaceae bacterium]
MNRLWPVIVLLVIVSLGVYIWAQKESYDPYSVEEIDKMLAQDPPWLKGEGADASEDENIEDMILDSSAEEVVEPSNMAVLSASPEKDLEKLKIQAQKNWDIKIKSFFAKDLKLAPALISGYEKLKKEYIEKKKIEGGLKLFDQYSEELKSLLGRDHYIRYLEEKHHYNKEIAKQGDVEIEL